MTAGAPAEPHPLLGPLACLLGVWEGEGRGRWSEPPFRYLERVEMTHQGAPFLAYRQTTTTLDGAKSLHCEAGYLRPGSASTVEMVVAQPTGLVEVHAGRITAGRLRLRSTSVGRTERALAVTDVIRVIEVSGDVLTYEVAIAMHHEQPTAHLEARLHRIA